MAAQQSLITRQRQAPPDQCYNKPAAPLVRVNMDSGHLLGRSGLHSSQSRKESAYEEYTNPEPTRSQSRGFSDRRASAKRGPATKTPAVGHHKDSSYSYQSSVYDFSRQQAVSQAQRRPSSTLGSVDRAGVTVNKHVSATAVELQNYNGTTSAGLHAAPQQPARSQPHTIITGAAGAKPSNRPTAYGAVI